MSRYKAKVLVNILTILRVVAIPALFFINDKYVLFFVVNFLFFTDFLDGYIARKYDATSTSGAVLDLLADKILVITLLLVAYLGDVIPFILFFLISFREVYSMITRYTYYKKEKKLIQASMMGKTKTTLQFISLSMMMLEVPGYQIMLWVVVILSYWSFLEYFKISKKGE